MAVLLGAKPPIVFKEYVLSTSQTWTAPITGTIKVTCTGGGGQGGLTIKGTQTNVNDSCKSRGGGAGGFSQKTIPVKVGDTFTVVVGAGGRNANTAPNSTTNGTSGGESTFDNATAISTIALDSNGGVGGSGLVQQDAGTRAGGAGGTASGGDLNVAGGAGGAIIVSNQSSKDGATGGGAVSMYGVAYAGGAITHGGNANAHCATGGGGCLGAGGSFVQNGSNDTFFGGTQGGGNIGPGAAFVTADMGATSTDQNSNDTRYRANNPSYSSQDSSSPQGGGDGLFQTGPKSTNSGSNNGSNSATGSSGVANSGQTARLGSQNAYCINTTNGTGPFAGGGGMVVNGNTNSTGTGITASTNGDGGFGGGGSGGICLYDEVTLDWKGGGQGCVIVSYIG